tara:strand:+ start:13022 stop:14497 length:1476 start_codon:yes stop_codon:yes gene_type:complete
MPNKSSLKTYNDFFFTNENLKPTEIKVVLLSNFDAESHTANDFEKSFKKKTKLFYPININKAKLKTLSKGTIELSDGVNKTVKLNRDNTVILTRRGVIKNTKTKNLVVDLERKGFYIFNSLASILNCECKWSTYRKLKEAGLPTPATALLDDVADIDSALAEIGGSFPLIIKTLSGSHGIGVSIVDSLESLKSVLQTIWKLKPGIEVILQEKIEADSDLRIHILTKKFNHPINDEDPTNSVLLGYMRRNKIDNDFRTNHSLGGTVEKTEVTDEQAELCIAASKVMGCNWCGVDIIEDKETGKNYILEINASPGTIGLKKATGIDVLGSVADFVLDQNNWISEKHSIGFREMIHIDGIGDVVAKFDTGNGSIASALHADKYTVNGDTVKWEIGSKRFSNKIVQFSNTEVGNIIEKRPVIEMNVSFMGNLFKNVPISLDNRTTKSTKFLVNRKLMEAIGVSVSPSKVFIVTKKPKKYSAIKTKEQRHGGIYFK